METPRAVWNTGPSLDSTTRAVSETTSATGYSGIGCSAEDRKATASAAASILAHQRQWGEGSVPVGVSSRTKPVQER
jgi:hypothetical protein